MNTTIYYNKISNTTEILAIDIAYSGYQIRYQNHYIENDERDMQSFYQSRKITQDEFDHLVVVLAKEFIEKNVPDFLVEEFERQIDVENV